MSKEDGGHAFPRSVWTKGPDDIVAEGFNHGMSLRDWFAGQALIGRLAGTDLLAPGSYALVAASCYHLADAMLLARKGA